MEQIVEVDITEFRNNITRRLNALEKEIRDGLQGVTCKLEAFNKRYHTKLQCVITLKEMDS